MQDKALAGLRDQINLVKAGVESKLEVVKI